MLKRNKRIKWGTYLTAFYLGLIISVIWSLWPEGKVLEPNEMGDMLAGIFGPVAFLWLILGYLQQGEELKQNTKALHLQAEELKNSVEEQKNLVLENQKLLDHQQQLFKQHVDHVCSRKE